MISFPSLHRKRLTLRELVRTPLRAGFLQSHARPTATLLVVLLLAGTLLAPAGFAESPGSLYKKGRDAEARQNYEAAYEFFKAAYDKNPKDIRYRSAYERLRFQAAMVKVHRGQLLRSMGKLPEALAEFQNAAAIEPSLQIADQESKRTQEMMQANGEAAPQSQPPPNPNGPISQILQNAQGPVELQAISDQPITLKLTEDSRTIYETIGKLAGINVLFDPDYTSRRVRIELNGVSLQDALQIVALESKTFWRPVTKNTIFVAADNTQKRKELEQNVIKTFYLSNISQPTDLQDVVNALRTILELQRVQQLPSQNAIVVRGTPDQIALTEKLIGDIDKAKPEVVIDIAVMQVSRNKSRTLGISPPTNFSVGLNSNLFQDAGKTTTTTSGTTTTTTTSGGTTTPTSGSSCASGSNCTFNTFKHLTSLSYSVSIPAATAQFLFSDSDSKIIQNPQIRALDGGKASLKIGDRVPVATGSFANPFQGAGGGLGNIGAVQTQFQYIDVGVNMDITPKVHADNEVTLKVLIDVSSVTSHVSIGGIDQPVIGQRKIEHEIRLKEGEVNIMGGIFEDQEVNSWSGIPVLGQIPLFRYLFAQQNKTHDESEIVFVMVPHIVRQQVITLLNKKSLDIGSGTSIELRHVAQPKPEVPAQPTPAPANPANQPQVQQQVQPPSPVPNQPPAEQQQSPPANPSGSAPPGSPPQSGNAQGVSQAASPPSQAPGASNQNPANAQTAANVNGSGPNAPTSAGQNGPSLRFDPPLTTQVVGSTATVNVLVDSQALLHSMSMQLKYDPTLLQLINVANGGYLSRDGQTPTVVHRDDGRGTVQISGVRPPGAPGLSGSGALFTLLFQLKAPGGATVSPVSFMARDAAGNPIVTSAAGQAMLQIVPPIPK